MSRGRPKARFSIVVNSGGANDMTEMSSLMSLAMGGIISAVGLAIVFLGLGWIPIDPSRVHAPMWVIGISGLAFLLPGLLMCYYGVQNGLTEGASPTSASGKRTWDPGWLVGVLMVSVFAAISLWVGLGSGPREFSGDLSGSERGGRIVFGLVGLFCA
ncbi:MAG: hypothetical protein ACR2QM_20725, partial [Longimicrobiales bacterium]